MAKNFTDDENYLLAVAFRTISQDKIVGVEQSMAVLWGRVCQSFRDSCKEYFKSDRAAYTQAITWKPHSLRNRFDRFMKPSVPNYNKAVKATGELSGESEEDHQERVLVEYMRIAKIAYDPAKKEKFMKLVSYLPRVAEELNMMPQFGGSHGNAEHDNRSNNGSVYTANETPLPMGTKKAKGLAYSKLESARKKDKTEEAKVAAFEGMREMMGKVAHATVSIAETMKGSIEIKRIDSRIKQHNQLMSHDDQLLQMAGMYSNFGKGDEAMKMMETLNASRLETRAHLLSIMAASAAPLPESINTASSLDNVAEGAEDVAEGAEEASSADPGDVEDYDEERRTLFTIDESLGQGSGETGGECLDSDTDNNHLESETESEHSSGNLSADLSRINRLGTKHSAARKRLAQSTAAAKLDRATKKGRHGISTRQTVESQETAQSEVESPVLNYRPTTRNTVESQQSVQTGSGLPKKRRNVTRKGN